MVTIIIDYSEIQLEFIKNNLWNKQVFKVPLYSNPKTCAKTVI